jgi:hypothetical protein
VKQHQRIGASECSGRCAELLLRAGGLRSRENSVSAAIRPPGNESRLTLAQRPIAADTVCYVPGRHIVHLNPVPSDPGLNCASRHKDDQRLSSRSRGMATGCLESALWSRVESQYHKRWSLIVLR